MNHTLKAIIVLLFVLLQWTQQAKAQGSDKIIYNQPFQLTQSMLERHAKLVQQLLDLTYTEEQRQKHFDLVKAYWRKNDTKGMQAIIGNLQFYDEIVAKPAEEQKAFVRQTRSALLINLIEDDADDSRWYLSNYYATHPPLSNEGIPLFKETADDLLNAEYFINKTLKRQPMKPLTKTQRDTAYKQLVAVWKTTSREDRKKLMLHVSKLAHVEYEWKNLAALDHTGLRLQFVGRKFVSNAEYQQHQQAMAQLNGANAQVRGQQWQLVQNELNYMKSSTDIIMSKGIRWNPSLNRYEQIGGIVTEYW